MTTASTSTTSDMTTIPPDLDPHQETAESMLQLYRQMHSQGCPVVHSTAHGGFYLLNSYAEIRRAARDWQTFSSANGVNLPKFPTRNAAIDYDPPEHTYWRGVFGEILSTKAIREAEDSVRQDAIRLINGFAGNGEADLVAELAEIIPGNTICRLLGITQPDRIALGCRLGVRLAESTFNPILAQAAFGAFAQFVMEEIGTRRQQPQDDFLTRVATSQIEGHQLTDDEIVGLCTGFLIAGHHTTTAGLAILFHTIATDSRMRDQLIADPSLIPKAAEEAIRLESPLHGFYRTTTRDVEIAGTLIPKGSEVFLNYQAGNRDPEAFENPEQFELTRKPNAHLAFGHGVHVCSGAPLSRLEMRIVTEELLKRIPDLVSAGEPMTRRWGAGIIMSVDRVQVTFTPSPAVAG